MSEAIVLKGKIGRVVVVDDQFPASEWLVSIEPEVWSRQAGAALVMSWKEACERAKGTNGRWWPFVVETPKAAVESAPVRVAEIPAPAPLAPVRTVRFTGRTSPAECFQILSERGLA